MKTERSEARPTARNRKDGGDRAESTSERDPDAFERLMEKGRTGKRESSGTMGKARRPRGDIGDEESWRGKVVDGEAQLDSREARRGQVEHKRARDEHIDAKLTRELRRDDARASNVDDRRRDERADSPSRESARAEKDRSPAEKADARAMSNTGDTPSTVEADPGHGRAIIDAGPATSKTSSASEQMSTRQSEVAQIAEKIVESAKTGFDAEGRKLMSMTLDIPGRGRLEIRLRKHGSKMQVELAAESPAFGRLLRRSRKDLKQQTRQRGVQLSSVRVSR
jgi:hypothetical protein